jgi:uncharacterized membrane protein YkoI
MRLVRSIAAASFALLALAARPAFAGPLEDIFSPGQLDGVLPMERILHQAQGSVPGKIFDIGLERDRGRLVYEVLVISPDNQKIEVKYDAKTGAELSREVKRRKRKG